jgi:hypothetical protein
MTSPGGSVAGVSARATVARQRVAARQAAVVEALKLVIVDLLARAAHSLIRFHDSSPHARGARDREARDYAAYSTVRPLRSRQVPPRQSLWDG